MWRLRHSAAHQYTCLKPLLPALAVLYVVATLEPTRCQLARRVRPRWAKKMQQAVAAGRNTATEGRTRAVLPRQACQEGVMVQSMEGKRGKRRWDGGRKT